MEKKNPDSELNKFFREEKRFLEDLKSIDLEMNWERFQQSVHGGSVRSADHRVKLNYRFLLRIAAAVVLLLAVSVTLYITAVLPAHHMIRASAESSHMEITLSEGTVISLNQGAVISYPERMTRRNRTVILSGEAFFDVSKVLNSRFCVEVGSMTVRVTGTAFNIREDPSGNIEVSVVEGEVLFYETGNTDAAVRIKAGQRSTYLAAQEEFENDHLDSQNFLFWRTGSLAYQDTPLKVVFEELGKYFDRAIVIEDSSVMRERWNSVHRATQLDEILEELSDYFDLECTTSNDSILVQRKQP